MFQNLDFFPPDTIEADDSQNIILEIILRRQFLGCVHRKWSFCPLKLLYLDGKLYLDETISKNGKIVNDRQKVLYH